ncbi:MAG TPA: MFS transporter, partial [Geobacteraceae bacterium]
ATALFIGLGGILGYLSFCVELLPEAAVAPILVFIGIEITSQAFTATPRRHYEAIALAFLPVVACLVQIEFGLVLGSLGKSAADLSGDIAATYRATQLLGNGFIVTSLLWGGAFASLLDHALRRAALFLAVATVAALCGIIHSPLPSGALFLPWTVPDPIVRHLAAGYLAMALVFFVLGLKEERAGQSV